MGKVTRSYALDPSVAAYLDRQPDGRGKSRSRSMLVSEAVYYYWMVDGDTDMHTCKQQRLAIESLTKELHKAQANQAIWRRILARLRR